MSHQEISDRAYFIWQNTGCQDAEANWKQATLEIMADSLKKKTPKEVFTVFDVSPSTVPNVPNVKPNVTLRLNNPGIGDSSFIFRDKDLRKGLEQFSKSSYELKELPGNASQICGGFEYDLVIMDQHDEIRAFVNEWEQRRSRQVACYESEEDDDSDDSDDSDTSNMEGSQEDRF